MKRRDPNAEPIVFRVLHLPTELIESIRRNRKENNGQTLKDFTWQIVEEGLAPLVEALHETFPNPVGARRAMKIPLSDRILTELRSAANLVNIPSTRILQALLLLATQNKRGPGQHRGRKKQATEPAAGSTAPEAPASEETPRRGRRKGTGGGKQKKGSPENLVTDHSLAPEAKPEERMMIGELAVRSA